MADPLVGKRDPGRPLSTVAAGQLACVVAVDGGWGAATRLAHLGLMPGHVVRMVRPSWFGPVLVDVKGSRLALGQGLARKIIVQLIDSMPVITPAVPAPAVPA